MKWLKALGHGIVVAGLMLLSYWQGTQHNQRPDVIDTSRMEDRFSASLFAASNQRDMSFKTARWLVRIATDEDLQMHHRRIAIACMGDAIGRCEMDERTETLLRLVMDSLRDHAEDGIRSSTEASLRDLAKLETIQCEQF